MNNPLGCHYPNGNFRGMNDFYSIKWKSFVVLSDQRNAIPDLRAAFSDARILVRAYLPNWYAKDPVQWAGEIAGWWPDCAPYRCELTFANEENLSSEGHPGAAAYDIHPRNLNIKARAIVLQRYPAQKVYEDIRDWNLKVIAELRRLLPSVVLHFPALSQGHSDDENDAGYVGFEILRPAVDACDILDAHTYWNGAVNRESVYFGRRYEELYTLFPGKEIFISECGSDVDMQNDDGADYVAWLNGLPPYVSAACFFIWDSDVNNDFWAIYRKANIVSAFQNYTPAPPPTPPTPTPAPPPVGDGCIAGAIKLIKQFEGFAAVPTRDVADRYVIGYGHTIGKDEKFTSITEDEASVLLSKDIQNYANAVKRGTKVRLSDNQCASLLSFCYNVGISSFLGSDLLAKLNKMDYNGAANEFLRWVKAQGVVLPGLVRRRCYEADAFRGLRLI